MVEEMNVIILGHVVIMKYVFHQIGKVLFEYLDSLFIVMLQTDFLVDIMFEVRNIKRFTLKQNQCDDLLKSIFTFILMQDLLKRLQEDIILLMQDMQDTR